jgi:hypothetical protein
MFRSVYSVSLCCCVYCLCVNVYCTAAIGISGHFSTTLNEGFRDFPQLEGKLQSVTHKDGARSTIPNFFFLLLYICMVCLKVSVNGTRKQTKQKIQTN